MATQTKKTAQNSAFLRAMRSTWNQPIYRHLLALVNSPAGVDGAIEYLLTTHIHETARDIFGQDYRATYAAELGAQVTQ